MKFYKFLPVNANPDPTFQILRLGIHEPMMPGIVDRPGGTGDYLVMLFQEEVDVKTDRGIEHWPTSSLIIWTPTDGHFYGNSKKAWNHSWFHCAGSIIKPLFRSCCVPMRQRIQIRDASFFTKYLLDTTQELRHWSPANTQILIHLFKIFLEGLVRQQSQPHHSITSPKLREVQNYVEQNYHEKIRLRELSKMSGYSIPYLCAEFKKAFGIPITQYVLQLRMNQASYLLRDRNRSIGEIATMVGYPDLYAFSKMFKRALGISPTCLRKQQGTEANPQAAVKITNSHK